MDDGVGFERGDRRDDGITVADVQHVGLADEVDADDVVVGGPEQGHQLGAELAAGSGDQDAHQRFFTRSVSGRHQASLSTNHEMVASMASAKPSSGFQPSARTLSVAME